MRRRLLIVDDDPRIRTSLSEALQDEALRVESVDSGEAALTAIARTAPDIVLSDVRMPGMTGLELLALLKERAPGVAVILMTAFDDLATVVAAMREGAVDFLVKPVDLHQLRSIIDRVIRDRVAAAAVGSAPGRSEASLSRPETGDGRPAGRHLIGHDPRMIRIFKIIGQVAQTRTNVVIRGESGTGKELIPRASA